MNSQLVRKTEKIFVNDFLKILLYWLCRPVWDTFFYPSSVVSEIFNQSGTLESSQLFLVLDTFQCRHPFFYYTPIGRWRKKLSKNLAGNSSRAIPYVGMHSNIFGTAFPVLFSDFFSVHAFLPLKKTRVLDPDPHGSALIWVAGSGSAYKYRIRIQEGKNYPQK